MIVALFSACLFCLSFFPTALLVFIQHSTVDFVSGTSKMPEATVVLFVFLHALMISQHFLLTTPFL